MPLPPSKAPLNKAKKGDYLAFSEKNGTSLYVGQVVSIEIPTFGTDQQDWSVKAVHSDILKVTETASTTQNRKFDVEALAPGSSQVTFDHSKTYEQTKQEFSVKAP